MISKPNSTKARRYILVSLGLLFVLTAIVLPTAWYDHIPKSRENLPEPPIKGVTLVRLCFGLEGLFLLYFALTERAGPALGQDDLVLLPSPMMGGASDIPHPMAWVAAATFLGAALRIHGLNSDLWIDEITTVFDYLNVSTFHIVVSYTASNNHLLNTLLVQGMVHAAGMKEWAIRLPAVLCGIASIPAIYYLARTALGRRESVWAAFLLAVSYHHIFFSQNARGYSALLLWGILGTAFFLRGLTSTQLRYWVFYVLAMFLGVATILYSLFIVAGHGLAFLAACWIQRRQRRPVGPLAVRAVTAWALLGLVSFHLYASSLPQVYVYMQNVYRSPSGGYAPLSFEYVREMLRGLSVGLGGTIGVLAALAIGGLGFVTFFRRHALFCLTLILPLIVTASFVLLLNLIVLPRSFLWGLPVACIFAAATAAGLRQVAGTSGRVRGERWRRLIDQSPTAIVGVLILLSAASLPTYYRIPKQPNRASLAWVVAQKKPDDPVVAIYLAEWGVRFYGPRVGLRENESFWAIRSENALQDFENKHPTKTIWLLTTLPRALHLTYPALERHIADRYRCEKTFPATIGGGEISAWRLVR
jgi:mannosyltransferase